MIKEIKLINWKSFKDSILYIDPLSILIGSNASGKSNIIEALVFIKKILGKDTIEEALKMVRGGVEYAALWSNEEFAIEMLIEKDSETDYEYSITVSTVGTPETVNERLSIIQKRARKI